MTTNQSQNQNQIEAGENTENEGLLNEQAIESAGEQSNESHDNQDNDNVSGEPVRQGEDVEKERNRQGYQLRQQMKAIREENERLKRQLEGSYQKPTAQHEQPKVPRIDPNAPKLQDFDSTEEWMHALTEYTTKRAYQQLKEEESAKSLLNKYAERAEAFAVKNPDYFDAEEALTGRLSPAMQKAIAKSEFGPHVVMELYKDPILLTRLNRMDVTDQLIEFAEIQAKVKVNGASATSRNTAQQVSRTSISNASQPPAKVKTGGGSKPDVLNMSREEYARYMSSL